MASLSSRVPETTTEKRGILSTGALIPPQESVYTQEQLDLYLDKIQYHRYEHLVGNSSDAPLIKLQLLMRLHIVTFSWENTNMHYSADHIVDVTPQSVFQRLVVDGAGGSYCFGHNSLFQGMLRRLRYRVYSAAARVMLEWKEGDPLPPWAHMILLVQPFDNNPTTYLTDAGFGVPGQCRPILLSDRYESQGTTETERHRIIKMSPPTSTSPIPSWQLQITHNPHHTTPTWSPVHIFTEYEAVSADYIISNYSLCRLPAGRSGALRSNIMCCIYTLANPEDALESDLSRCILHGDRLKQSIGAKSELVKLFKEGEEKERILALAKYFGIKVDDEGEKYIEETPARL